jgi:predicted lipoprotein with Yx(FWY)xxD motif
MRTRSFLVLALAIGLIGAACAAPAASPTAVATTPAATTPAATTAAATSPATSPTTAAGGETVAVATDAELGQILVDGEGRTLYGFMNDTNGVPTCYDACAANWPALVVTGDITVGAGLDASDFMTVERTDGGMQVKVGDRPLYRFANDAAAGDTNGQGFGGVWFVVGPDGELIQQ